MTAQQPEAHIKEPYTLAEIKAKIASNEYSAEMLLQHAMLLLEGVSLSANADYPQLPEPKYSRIVDGLPCITVYEHQHMMRAYVDADRAMQAQATPQQEPSCTAVKLAEMVLSDCGHSSNYTPLLDRIAERIDAHVQRHLDELQCCLESKPMPKPSMSQVDALDMARSLFDAGWKACAKFCDRDDAIYDGIVGSMGCPEFETAFDAVWAACKDKS